MVFHNDLPPYVLHYSLLKVDSEIPKTFLSVLLNEVDILTKPYPISAII